MSKHKILTFTPVWQRPEVFEICLAGLERLKNYKPEKFYIRPFFIVSEFRAARMVEEYGYDYILWQNLPLGAKKNAGLRYAMENYQFDYLMEVGSDDIIANDYLDFIAPELENKTPHFVANKVWMFDVVLGKSAYAKTDKIIGAGRCIHYDALKSFAPDYELWEPEKNRGLDTSSWQRLLQTNVSCKLLDTEDHYTLDIKSNVNIHPIHAFHVLPDSSEMLANFQECGQIWVLHEQLRETISPDALKEHNAWNNLRGEEKLLVEFLQKI